MQTRTASQNESMPTESGAPSVGSDESRRSSLAEASQKIGGRDHDSDRSAKRVRLSREASNASGRRSSTNSQDLKIATRSKTALAEAESQTPAEEANDEPDNDVEMDEAQVNGSQEANGVVDDAKPPAKKPWLTRRKRRRGLAAAAAKKANDAGSGYELLTPEGADGLDGVDRQSPGKVEPGEILRRLPGRRRAPHADPTIEADLRRQLELKVAYRAVVKALKPVLVELAARTAKELDEDRELYKQYPEYEEVMDELNRRLESRLSVLNAWYREEDARIKRMKESHSVIIGNQFASKFQEMRENLILECKHEFLSVVRQIEAADDGDATEDEDGIIPRLYHNDLVTGKRWGLDPRYDSRSRVFMETEQLWNESDLRHNFREEQKRQEPDSINPRPKGFAVYDGGLRRRAIAGINLNLLVNAGKAIGDQEQRAARGEVSNEAAVGLQALVQASDIATTQAESVPAPVTVVQKMEKSPSVARGQKRPRSPEPNLAITPSPHKPAIVPSPPKKQEEPFEPLSFKPSERGERPFDLPMAASTETRLPPDASSARQQYDLAPGRPPSRNSYPPMYNASVDRPQLPPISVPHSASDHHDGRYAPRHSLDFPDLRHHPHHQAPMPLEPRPGQMGDHHPHNLPPLAPAPHLGYHPHHQGPPLPPPPPSSQKDPLITRPWEPGLAPRKRPGPRPHYSTRSPSSFGPPVPQPQFSPFANSMGPPIFAPQYAKDPTPSRRSSGPHEGSAASSPVPKHEQPSGSQSGRKSNELREIRAYVPHSEVGQHSGYSQPSPTSQAFPRPVMPGYYQPNNMYGPFQPPGGSQYDPTRPPNPIDGPVRGPPLSPHPSLLLQRGHHPPHHHNSPPPAPGQHSSTPPGGYGHPPPPPHGSGSPRHTPGSMHFAPPYNQSPHAGGPSPPPQPPPSGSGYGRPPSLPPPPPGPPPHNPISMQHPGQSMGGHQPILPATMDPNRSRPAPPPPPPQTQIMRFPSYVSPQHSNQGSMSVFSAFTPPRRYDPRLERGSVAASTRSRSPALRGSGSGRGGRGGRKAKEATSTAASPASNLRNSQTPGEESLTPHDQPDGNPLESAGSEITTARPLETGPHAGMPLPGVEDNPGHHDLAQASTGAHSISPSAAENGAPVMESNGTAGHPHFVGASSLSSEATASNDYAPTAALAAYPAEEKGSGTRDLSVEAPTATKIEGYSAPTEEAANVALESQPQPPKAASAGTSEPVAKEE